MNAIGFDVGTRNLVVAKRNKEGEIEYKREVNAFIEIPLEDRYVFNMLKKSGVPLIEKEKIAYAVGETAASMAYTLNKIPLRRPMQSGCLNPNEKDAFFVLSVMLHSLIGNIDQDKIPLYYTIPANAVNEISDADYHQKVIESIFKKYSHNGMVVEPKPINEALAVIFAELENKKYTGISASFGSGCSNICYAIYSTPVFSFSVANAGDWIDGQTARSTGENPNFITREKEKIDLTKQPTSTIERAIQTQYRIMIEKTVDGIKQGIQTKASNVRIDEPVDFVITGGTSTPKGFEKWFKEVLDSANIGIPIGEIRKPKDTLYTVARGALICSENSIF